MNIRFVAIIIGVILLCLWLLAEGGKPAFLPEDQVVRNSSPAAMAMRQIAPSAPGKPLHVWLGEFIAADLKAGSPQEAEFLPIQVPLALDSQAAASEPVAAPIQVPAQNTATPVVKEEKKTKAEQPASKIKGRRVMAMVTGYCPCAKCCGRGAIGRTSIGWNAWRPGIASDPTVIPYYTTIYVPNYGKALVDDTGNGMRQSWRIRGKIHIDLRFSTHRQAQQWGVKNMEITLLDE